MEKTLRKGVVQGDILVWREIYSHGPVCTEPAVPEHRAMRADYLERTIGVPRLEYLRISEAQERTLADFHRYDEVVLWFEHDIFDQTMLCYLLYWFSRQSLKKTKLSLLSIGEFPGIELFRGLGQLSREQMATLSGTWAPVGVRELELGSALWQAYTSPDPSLLQQVIAGDTSALPFAHSAYQSHLARFPSTHNGVGLVEQTTLELVHAGIRSPLELFKQVGDKLHRLGMGDLQYWHVLKKMSEGPCPLLQLQGIQVLPAYQGSPLTLQGCEVIITELGRAVMEGTADWASLQGIDEWYGGVHLTGHAPRWRWNAALQRIEDAGKG
ncbi:DUF1835 domain-containing protein [Paenibacillus filicis]|uniref:DUF1835 domain-containing protein n=1 Tax=Paenibacillus filicis TaxID=669464 RepID=A0ABU9DUH8_9BACL